MSGNFYFKSARTKYLGLLKFQKNFYRTHKWWLQCDLIFRLMAPPSIPQGQPIHIPIPPPPPPYTSGRLFELYSLQTYLIIPKEYWWTISSSHFQIEITKKSVLKSVSYFPVLMSVPPPPIRHIGIHPPPFSTRYLKVWARVGLGDIESEKKHFEYSIFICWFLVLLQFRLPPPIPAPTSMANGSVAVPPGVHIHHGQILPDPGFVNFTFSEKNLLTL